MRLAVFASHVRAFGEPFGDALKRARAMGIEGIEADSSEFAVIPPREYKTVLEDAGMRMIAVHHICRLAAADDEVFNEAVEGCRRAATEISASGAEYMMLVPSTGQDVADMDDKPRARARIIEGMKKASDFAAENGLKLCIENFSIERFPFSTPDELCDMAENVPGLYLTLDAGNIRCLGRNCIELYEKIADRLLFCHLKDWSLTDEGGLLATDGKRLRGTRLGSGVVPIGELVFRLKTGGFNGWLVIEQENSPGLTVEDCISAAAAYLRRLI